MSFKVKTYCDAVKSLINLFTVLGFEFWYVYFEVWNYETPSTFYSTKEPCDEVPAGMGDKIHTALIVSDPIGLILESQTFDFQLKEGDELDD